MKSQCHLAAGTVSTRVLTIFASYFILQMLNKQQYCGIIGFYLLQLLNEQTASLTQSAINGVLSKKILGTFPIPTDPGWKLIKYHRKNKESREQGSHCKCHQWNWSIPTQITRTLRIMGEERERKDRRVWNFFSVKGHLDIYSNIFRPYKFSG